MIKICFFDIDGTLASLNRTTMPESTIQTLDALKENGIYVFINSGRTIAELPTFAKNYRFDGYILGCGIRATLNDKELFFNKFDDNFSCLDIFNRIKQFGFEAAFEADDYGALFYGNSKSLDFFKNNFAKSGAKIGTYDDFKPFQKFVIYTKDENKAKQFLKPFQKYVEYYMVEVGDIALYEIVPKNCTKAKGMKKVIELLNIDIDDVYVFGDSGNDIPMLKMAKHSIVLGNGTQSAKKYAEYITTSDCDHDGIKEACLHYGLIK